MDDNEKRDSVPYPLLIAVMIVLIAALIVAPVLWNLVEEVRMLKNAWVIEYKKARKMNRQLQEEQWSRYNNSDN